MGDGEISDGEMGHRRESTLQQSVEDPTVTVESDSTMTLQSQIAENSGHKPVNDLGKIGGKQESINAEGTYEDEEHDDDDDESAKKTAAKKSNDDKPAAPPREPSVNDAQKKKDSSESDSDEEMRPMFKTRPAAAKKEDSSGSESESDSEVEDARKTQPAKRAASKMKDESSDHLDTDEPENPPQKMLRESPSAAKNGSSSEDESSESESDLKKCELAEAPKKETSVRASEKLTPIKVAGLQVADKEGFLTGHGLHDDGSDVADAIIGSLAGPGSKVLGVDLSKRSSRYHCFSLSEIRHVLQRESPTAMFVPGLERLRDSDMVYKLISEKIKESIGWRCSKIETILSVSEMNKELDDLKDNFLKNVTPWGRGSGIQRKGNTSYTSRVLKKVKSISKMAKRLKRDKVQGLIAKQLCGLIERDFPNYLKDNVEELQGQVEIEKDRPVWFCPETFSCQQPGGTSVN